MEKWSEQKGINLVDITKIKYHTIVMKLSKMKSFS